MRINRHFREALSKSGLLWEQRSAWNLACTLRVVTILIETDHYVTVASNDLVVNGLEQRLTAHASSRVRISLP